MKSTSLKDWVVYRTPEKKITAVEDTHSQFLYDDLRVEHNVVLGFPAAKTKADAIRYVEEIISQS